MKTLEKQNIKAYLNLIQELLACPRGEEWIVLRKNEELVNSELVVVMEQVANYLTNSGDIKAARYLHNWAGKLHHILMENVPIDRDKNDKAHDYIELIEAVLSCPEGKELEVLTAHQDLIDPELVRIMNQVAERMQPRDPETANYLYALAADLDRTWIEHHEFEPTYKPEIAPDPWLDNEDSSCDRDESAEIASQETEQLTPLPTQPRVEQNDSLMTLLTKVANLFDKLETTLATQLQPQNPLWYMEALEKAIASNWILSTEEVEKLIGVKPHCEHNETTYHRGSWVFTKVGKVGAQTGWKVSKEVSCGATP